MANMRRRGLRATGTGNASGRKPGAERPRRRTTEHSDATGRKTRTERPDRRTAEHRFETRKKSKLIPTLLIAAAVVVLLGLGYYVMVSGNREYWVAMARMNQWISSQRSPARQQIRERYRKLPIGRVSDPVLREIHVL